ncbi:sugar phosphate isomerase/epimerase family protein [candidate division KSB1 bacterium]
MNTRKISVIINTFVFCTVLFTMPACQSGPEPSDIQNWVIGTSASRLMDYSQEDFIQLKQIGFDCVEMGLRGLDIDNITDSTYAVCTSIYENATSAGVNIWSIHIPYGWSWDISNPDETERNEIIERLKNLFTISEYLKPEKLVIHGSFEPVPDDEREQRLSACRESLMLLGDDASRYGAQLVIECLPRTCLGNSSHEILALIEGIESISVCCDVNHLLTETPQEFISRVGPRVTTLHISDYDGLDEKHWLPGEGIIDWNSVLESLVGAGYSGPFMFECAGTPQEKMQTWNKMKNDYLTFAETEKSGK